MNKKINISGKKIFYRVFGQGKTVMLVHGFGETGEVWKNQIAFLENDFCLIVPDLPGSGESEMIDDMSMEGMAEALKLILETEDSQQVYNAVRDTVNTQTSFSKDSETKEGLPQSESLQVPSLGGFSGAGAVMIGHSMGGYITLAFVHKYPGYLSSFGLFHSFALADNDEKKETRKKGIAFIRQHGAFEFLKNSTPNLFSPLSKSDKPDLIDGFIRSLSNFSAGSLVSYYESMIQRPDRTEILKITALPVLFVMGEFDNAIPLQDVLPQSHIPEKSYIHILHQSGHMGMLEEEEKSNQILKKFLSET